jgi:ribosome-binding protein aMBF1 (putative translation factor)
MAFSDSANLTPVARRSHPRIEEVNSPVGRSVVDFNAEQERLHPEYRREAERTRPLFELAKLMIIRRTELGITQQELARRMGTSHSVISRLESGRHKFSMATLQRLARALDTKLVCGFEPNEADEPEAARRLVIVS